MFLQNRNFSNGILIIILIPPWFQACIYWKKFVIWRHHIQPSIFSMTVSLFHCSTWSNLHVKETVFISQYFLQPSIIINGLRLIREKVEEYVYLMKTIVALLFSRWLFNLQNKLQWFLFENLLNAQKHLRRSHFFMAYQHSEITVIFSKK